MGEQPEESRATLIKDALDFPDELDSTEYCGKTNVNFMNIPLEHIESLTLDVVGWYFTWATTACTFMPKILLQALVQFCWKE